MAPAETTVRNNPTTPIMAREKMTRLMRISRNVNPRSPEQTANGLLAPPRDQRRRPITSLDRVPEVRQPKRHNRRRDLFGGSADRVDSGPGTLRAPDYSGVAFIGGSMPLPGNLPKPEGAILHLPGLASKHSRPAPSFPSVERLPQMPRSGRARLGPPRGGGGVKCAPRRGGSGGPSACRRP